MRKFLLKTMMLFSLIMGATMLNAQTGNVIVEIFPSTVPGTSAAHLTELREEKNATYTASWSAEIDRLSYGDGTTQNGNVTINLRTVAPGSPADNYNTRARGYLAVSEAGTYKFFIGSDDGAQFAINLSGPNPDPDMMTVVTSNSGYQGSWGNEAVKDPGHHLDVGYYAFCVTHNEGTGGDFAQIGVSFNDGSRYVVGTTESKITLSQTGEALATPSLINLPNAVQVGKTAIVYGIKFEVTQSDMNISDVSIPLILGASSAGDFNNYALYLNASASSLAGAVKLGESATLSGGNLVVSGITGAIIPAGTAGYLLVVVDVSASAGTGTGHSISGGAITSLSSAIATTGAPVIYNPDNLSSGSVVAIAPLTDEASKIDAATFTYPTNIDYKAYTGAWLNVGKFILSDVGSDGKPTTVNFMTLQLDGWENIASVSVRETESGAPATSVAVTGNMTTLPCTITAPSGGTKEFFVAVQFKTIVTDRATIGVNIADVVCDGTNSQLAANGLDNAETAQDGNENRIQVTATALSFLVQPDAEGIYGAALTRQPVVQAVDVNGSVDTDVNGVTVTLANSAGAVMIDNTATLTAGTATFSGFAIQYPETVTITASAPSLTSITSNEIVLVSNVYTKDTDWDYVGGKPTGQGALFAEVAMIIYESKATAGSPFTMQGFVITSGTRTTVATEIDSVSVTYNGAIFGTGANDGTGKFVITNSEGVEFTTGGDKTFRICIHVSPYATPGNRVDAILESMTVDGNVIPVRVNNDNVSRIVNEAMAGEYYVDNTATDNLFAAGGRTFTSFGDAMNELRDRGTYTGVTIIVKDDQEFLADGFRLENLGRPTANVVIKRSDDGIDMPHLMINSTNEYYSKAVHIANCSYLTLDGLFIDVQKHPNHSVNDPIGGIVIGNDIKPSENIVIQNCKIAVNQALSDRMACIGIRYIRFPWGDISNLSSCYMPLKNSKFINNEIYNCSQAICLEEIDGVEVSGNYIHDFTLHGININGPLSGYTPGPVVSNSIISGNTISDTATDIYPNPNSTYTGDGQHSCIQVLNMTENVSITGNWVHNVHNNLEQRDGYNTVLITGISAGMDATSTATNNIVANNMVWDIDAPYAYQGNSGSGFYAVRGIQVTGGGSDDATGKINVYNNSVYLTAQSEITQAWNTGAGSALRTVAFWSTGNSRPVLKNNIFVNKSSTLANVAAIDIPAARLSNGSDNNVYYAENTLSDGTPVATYLNLNGNIADLAAYQTQMSGRETATQFEDINFMLGLNALNVANDISRNYVVALAEPLAEVTHDIWGITRNPAPTIGAWEKPPIRQLTLTSATSDPAGPGVDEGSTIVITANAPDEGKAFDKWLTTTATLADATKSPTTFKVPGNDVTVEATYKWIDYTITVNGGGSPDKFVTNFTQQVTLTAPVLIGKTFNRWEGDDEALLSSTTNAIATFNMPSHNVTFTSVYDNIIYNISLTKGSSEKATAIYQESVTITADTPDQGMMFDKWTGGDSFLNETQRKSSTVTFSMPADNVSLTATYAEGIYFALLSGGTSNKPDGLKWKESVTITADVPEE